MIQSFSYIVELVFVSILNFMNIFLLQMASLAYKTECQRAMSRRFEVRRSWIEFPRVGSGSVPIYPVVQTWDHLLLLAFPETP